MREFGIASIVLLLALSSVTGPGERATHVVTDPIEVDLDSNYPINQRLRVMSYNAFLRPPPVSWGDKNQCRSERLAQRLVDEPIPRDIIVLNETFDRRSVDRLAEVAAERFPYQVLATPEARGFRTNGGLSILSRYPLEKYSARRFSRCSGEFNDCLATKGVLWALVRVSEHLKVNVVATHMNSGLNKNAEEVRRAQLAEVREFIASRHETRRWPTLLMGDLNVNGLHYEPRRDDTADFTEYTRSMALMGNSCIACDTAACYATCTPYPVDAFRKYAGHWEFTPESTRAANTYNCLSQRLHPCTSPNDAENWTKRTRLDYIFHFGSPELSPDIDVRVEEAAARPFADDTCGTTYLSDHKAVEAIIEIERSGNLNAQMIGAGSEE